MAARRLKSLVRRSFGALGYRIERIAPPAHLPVYDSDGLTVRGKQVPFLENERFMSAYRRGINSGQRFGGTPNAEIHIEWRVAVTCWAAHHGSKLPGDFVECGVNTGIYSLAICEYVGFNHLNKSFYLFDTFSGIPEEQMSDAERQEHVAHSTVALHAAYSDL
jgi:O-methyltransferase